ncbi:MAG: protein kinase [Polyangiaceae bacterium]
MLDSSPTSTPDTADANAPSLSGNPSGVRAETNALGQRPTMPKGPRVIGDRFELIDQTALGGMAEIHRARDRWTDSYVALKRLTTRALADADRFRREARLLATLCHPGIVAHVAHGESANGEFYLVMEWLDGEDLAARVARVGNLGIDECLTVAVRVAEALAFAHDRGIVHRDLKPSNLFVEHGKFERTKILDFGLARLVEASHVLTRAGVTVGTPAYMAPEQVLSNVRVDTRADIWSLGCVLYECLTGVPPFRGDHMSAVFLKILHGHPVPIEELRRGVPANLNALVMQMLSKEPDERPQDGRIVVEALRAIRRTTMGSAPPSSLGRSEQRLMAFIVAEPTTDVVDDGDVTSPTVSVFEQGVDHAPVTREVERHGGRLNILADGTVVVSFESHGAATDLAKQSVRCALGIRDHWPTSRIAVALGQGESDARRPVSQALERVSAMIELGAYRGTEGTPSGSTPIRIDDTLAGLLDAGFEVVRGTGKNVLLREHPLGERPRVFLGIASPCVGREREIGTLRSVFEECVGDSVARVVMVTGPSGIGKTRLAYEFLRDASVRSTGPEVWRGTARATSGGAPLAVLASVVRSAANIHDGEAFDVRRQKLRQRLERYLGSDEARYTCEFLGELVGTPFDDSDSPALRAARQDATLMSERIRSAWEEFVTIECTKRPVILVLEDVQWADESSIRFMDTTLRRLKDRPLLVVATARAGQDDVAPRPWSERSPVELRLGALASKAGEKLIRSYLGAQSATAEVERIFTRSGGNPLFLEELVRAHVRGESHEFPETLLAMTQSRLEKLDGESRRVLRAATIFGSRFSRDGVARLLGESGEDSWIDRALASLTDAELVEPCSDVVGHSGVFTFRQDLTRESAYATLTPDDRALGHRLAASFLVENDAGTPIELAIHFDQGGSSEDAVHWYGVAAEEALMVADLDATARWTCRAIELGAEGAARGALLALQAQIAWRSQDMATAHRIGREAVDLLPKGSKSWWPMASTLSLVEVMGLADGELGGFARELLFATPQHDAGAPAAIALAATGMAFARLGRFEIASRFADAAGTVADRLGNVEASAHARVALLHSYDAAYRHADPWAQLNFAKTSVRACSRIGDIPWTTTATKEVGAALMSLGAFEAAERQIRIAADQASMSTFGLVSVSVRIEHAVSLAYLGQFDAALAVVRQALDDARDSRMLDVLAKTAFARIQLIAGHFDDAAEQARQLASKAPRTLADVEGHVILAAAELYRGRNASALASARRAMEWLDENRAIGPMEGLLRVTYAESLRANGAHAGAREALLEAKARLLGRADRVESPVLRMSFLERVPENARTLELAF